MHRSGPVRMVLIGAPGSELRRAAQLAGEAGAEVRAADGAAQAMEILRTDGGDFAMIDVGSGVPAFLGQLRAERFSIPVIACGVDAAASDAVAAIRAGARDYVPLPPDLALIAAAIASVAAERNQVLFGSSPALARPRQLGLAVARSSAPVLILGEPGTGKEMLARGIHVASGRPGAMLVADCAGAAPEFVESELFGHEEGAFAGASAQRIGQLERAGTGTIFLREVGALAPGGQAKLLDAIRDGVTRRVGGTGSIPCDTRIIVSSTVDLRERVAEGRFRADLFGRLGLMRIELPPLRVRGDDIAMLARHFVQRFSVAADLPVRSFSPAAANVIARYRWPGNVRELEEAMHRAVLLALGAQIRPEDVVLADGSPIPIASDEAARAEIDGLVGRTVEDVERELILETLAHCRGNRTSASSILGISVRTMRNKLKAFSEAGAPVSPAA